MNFIVRPIREEDLTQTFELAQQFSLLNLPANKKVIEEKIQCSIKSFNGELEKSHADYIFVIEELETGKIAGSSQLKAKHGTPEEPSYSFEVLKKERFSEDLGLGFIHQILRLKINEDGPTEVGGLVVNRNFRSRPEKVGKLISLCRFAYMALEPQRFEDLVYAQMAPPLTDEGRSEFWEALGRRFTGMPYHEADLLSQQNKEFIRSLFPEEDIYLCLLDAKARLVLGRVGQETQAALHMLESIGFKYNNEVDPFDGGPHLSCLQTDISIVKNGSYLPVVIKKSNVKFSELGIVGAMGEKGFIAGGSPFKIVDGQVVLPQKSISSLGISEGDKVFVSPIVSNVKNT